MANPSRAAATKDPEPKSTMPPVEKGMVVFWWPSIQDAQAPAAQRSSAARAALVVDVAFDHLALHIHIPDSVTLMCREGVRHVKDPRRHLLEMTDADQPGVWDYSDRDIQLRDLLTDLASRVEGLEVKSAK